MLIVTFRNVDEKNNVADYDVSIFVNKRKIDGLILKGHHRTAGWEGLVQDLAKYLNMPDLMRMDNVKKPDLTE